MAAEGADESQALDRIDEIAMKHLIPTKGLAATRGLTQEEADLIARWDRERAVNAEASAAHALLVGLYAVFFNDYDVMAPELVQAEMFAGAPRTSGRARVRDLKDARDEGARKVVVKRRHAGLSLDAKPETARQRVILVVYRATDADPEAALFALVGTAAMDSTMWEPSPDDAGPSVGDATLLLPILHKVLVAVVRGFFERWAVTRTAGGMKENRAFTKRLSAILFHYVKTTPESRALAETHQRMVGRLIREHRDRTAPEPEVSY